MRVLQHAVTLNEGRVSGGFGGGKQPKPGSIDHVTPKTYFTRLGHSPDTSNTSLLLALKSPFWFGPKTQTEIRVLNTASST